MERQRRTCGTYPAAVGGLMARRPGRTQLPPRPRKTAPDLFPTLQDFINNGGHIDLGQIDPIECAAIASDESSMYVALQRRDGETLIDLLTRLDVSLAHCLDHDEFIDEINAPSIR